MGCQLVFPFPTCLQWAMSTDSDSSLLQRETERGRNLVPNIKPHCMESLLWQADVQNGDQCISIYLVTVDVFVIQSNA